MRKRVWAKRIEWLLILCVTVPLLQACWDQVPIEQRATVLAVAIDEASPDTVRQQKGAESYYTQTDPVPDKPGIRLTAQIAVPGRLPLGAEGGETSGSAEKPPVWVLSVTAETVETAVADLQQEVSDRLFFGHLRLVVVSEKVARRGLDDLEDYLLRNPEVRRTAWLAVSQGHAEKLMTVAPPLERVPALYLVAMLEHSVEMGKFPRMTEGQFWSAYAAKGQEPYLPYLTVQDANNIRIQGLAYFRGAKMVGVTEPLQIGYFMGIMGMDPGGYSVLQRVPVRQKSAYYVYTTKNRKAKRFVELKNGRPHFTVKVYIEGDVSEIVDRPLTESLIRKMEKQLERSAKEGFEQLVNQTQKKQSDIFAFGEYVRGKLPAYWNEHIQTEERWREMYRDVPVNFELAVKIRRVGAKEN